MTRDDFFELYGQGIPADSPVAFAREPMELDGMIYSLQLEWHVRGHSSAIEVRANRGHSVEPDWKVKVRASGVNSGNTQRILDYASAMVDAAMFASNLDFQALEEAHQATVLENEIEAAKRKKESDALLAGDPELGASVAKKIIDGLVEKVKDVNADKPVRYAVIDCAKRRGSYWNEKRKVFVLDFYGDSGWNKSVGFRQIYLRRYKGLPAQWDRSDRIARKEVVCMLGESSEGRSKVHTFADGVALQKWYDKQKTPNS